MECKQIKTHQKPLTLYLYRDYLRRHIKVVILYFSLDRFSLFYYVDGTVKKSNSIIYTTAAASKYYQSQFIFCQTCYTSLSFCYIAIFVLTFPAQLLHLFAFKYLFFPSLLNYCISLPSNTCSFLPCLTNASLCLQIFALSFPA